MENGQTFNARVNLEGAVVAAERDTPLLRSRNRNPLRTLRYSGIVMVRSTQKVNKASVTLSESASLGCECGWEGRGGEC